MYINYFHFNNAWYYEESEIKKDRYIADFSEQYKNVRVVNFLNDVYNIEPTLTHHQFKEKIKEKYPDHILSKMRPYREGNRWYGQKHGSR